MQTQASAGKPFPVVTVGGACAAIRIIDRELQELQKRARSAGESEHPTYMYGRDDANGNYKHEKWTRPGRTPEQSGRLVIEAQIDELEAERQLWRVYLRACADNLPTSPKREVA